MKKIMFDDRYGLTKAVLEGRKTMTRRLIKCFACNQVLTPLHYNGSTGYDDFAIQKHAKYKVGEEVWIAQSYKSLGYGPHNWLENVDGGLQPATELAGYNNKMFVRSIYLEHRIRITGVSVQRLRDISDNDCLAEGVHPCYGGQYWLEGPARQVGGRLFSTPRKAFAFLIDRISGKGTWDKNPWVFAYTFELVR